MFCYTLKGIGSIRSFAREFLLNQLEGSLYKSKNFHIVKGIGSIRSFAREFLLNQLKGSLYKSKNFHIAKLLVPI